MSKSIQIRTCVAAALACLLGASCSDVTDSDSLPGGKYPMTFTGSVEGLSATRAATNGKDTWTENDEVAVSVDGGGSSKTYKITDASAGAMEPSVTGNPCYWQQKTGQPILAWYPAAGAGNVNISDQSSGFANFDYLAADVTRNFITEVISLPFKHQMAKVKYILQKGDGISDDDLLSATVKIKGYTLASFTNGKLTGAYAGNEEDNWITPVSADKEVLVVPQQMLDKQFIKVTVGGNDYFYTPTNATVANLKTGNVYTYTITVKKTKLEVTTGISTSWNDVDKDSGGTEEATFQIHLNNFTNPAHTSNYKVTDAQGHQLTASDNIYTSSDEINISLSADNGYRMDKFFTSVTKGICKVRGTYVAESRTYTYTFYDIRSDLWLSDIQAEAVSVSSVPASARVGDYYYVDGTWSSTLQKPCCIGIIFKIGAGADDSAGKYDGKLFAIHGYVVALTDALPTAGNWGTRAKDELITDVNDKNVTAYTGYSDTKTIIDNPQGDWNDYQAFRSVLDYRTSTPAPSGSSDWYLPSLAQLGDVYSSLDAIDTALTTAGTAFNTTTGSDKGWYWTSSEKTNSGYDAWHVSFRDGSKGAYAKNGTYYSSACYARTILTF